MSRSYHHYLHHHHFLQHNPLPHHFRSCSCLTFNHMVRVCVSVCERKWGNVWELQWHNWMDMCAETCGGGGERRRSSPNKNRGQSSFMVKRSSTCDLKCHGNFFGHLEEEGITHTPISRNINTSERSSEIHWSTCYKAPCCWETSSPEICCCTPSTPSGW